MTPQDLEALPTRAEHHDGTSTLRVWQPAPQVLITKIHGHISTKLAAVVIRESEASGPEYHTFLDWWQVESFDIMSQRDLTLWTARSRKRFLSVNILTQSVIVRVGISAANVPLSGLIKLSSEPAPFYAALTQALASRRGLG